MHLRSLAISGFKSFQDVTLQFHPRLNVLTGANNSGKTTALEAIALGLEVAHRLQLQANKANPGRAHRWGDWDLQTVRTAWVDLEDLRGRTWADLFSGITDEHNTSAALSMELAEGDERWTLPVQVRSDRGETLELSSPAPPERLAALRAALPKGPRSISSVWSTPVAAVRLHEPFVTLPQVRERVRNRAGSTVLRNRLERLYRDQATLGLLQDQMSHILFNRSGQVELRASTDPARDCTAEIEARIGNSLLWHELALYGSGTLQILELLLTLHQAEGPLTLVLMDEPDSHIHMDVQRRLLTQLMNWPAEEGTEVQIFLTTHNEALLRAVPWECLLHLPPGPHRQARVISPVVAQAAPAARRGQFVPIASPLREPLASVGAASAVEVIAALEASTFVLVEGEEDFLTVRALLIGGDGRPPRLAGWSLGGVGQLPLLPGVAHTLSLIQNGRSLRDKAILLLDRDDLTPEQADLLVQAFAQHLRLKVRFWPGRCLESSLLCDGPNLNLAEHLARLLGAPVHATEALLPAAWDRLCRRLEDNPPSFAALSARLSERLRLTQRALGLREGDPHPLGPVATLVDAIVTARRSNLGSNQLMQVADKDDVYDFIEDLRQQLVTGGHLLSDFPLPRNYWRDLMENVRRATLLSAWAPQTILPLFAR